MDSSSTPVMPTRPRGGAVGLWSVMFPPVRTPRRWVRHKSRFIPLFHAGCNFTASALHHVLILILSVAVRILIVPGNFMRQSWPVERISSIISPTNPHEYLLDSSYLHEQLLALFTIICLWCTWIIWFIKNKGRFLLFYFYVYYWNVSTANWLSLNKMFKYSECVNINLTVLNCFKITTGHQSVSESQYFSLPR